MKTTVETLFDELQVHWSDFETNHSQAIEKGNKQAAKRARAAIGEIKKKITDYKKASVIDFKTWQK